MTHHELLEELRLADPAPVDAKRPEAAWSSAVVLQNIQQRSGTMQTQNTQTSETPQSRPGAPGPTFRRWLIPAAAGATAVIIAIVTAVAIVGNSDEDVIAPTPEAVVLSSYEAWNQGDFDTWFGTFTDDALINGEAKQVWRLLEEVRVASNSRKAFLEPCRLIEPSPSGDSQVQCTVTRSNDFHGAGGLSVTVLETFAVDETNQISSYDASTVEQLVGSELAFNQAFWAWLGVAYPEVDSDIYPGLDTQPPGFGRGDPEDMLIALDYVEEFVAQWRP